MTKDELMKTHSLYDAFLADWRFYANSYRGGKFYRDGNYLVQHPYESAANYTRRKSIAYYYNYCAPIIDTYTSYLYKVPPKRSYGSLSQEVVPPRQPQTLFDSFWWDCDFEGTNFDQFVRDTDRYASIYGSVSVMVDKPQVAALTKAEAFSKDIRPYLTIILPENLLDWAYERLDTGRLVLRSVKIKESDTEYRIWTRSSWELWVLASDDKMPVLKETGVHALGEIPIVTRYNKKSGTRMVGLSDIQDIADINKNIYYFCSDAKEIIENTAFPMLALPYDRSSPAEVKETGPKSIMQFDPTEPNSKPYWMEPPHSSLAEIREWIQQDAQEMVRIAKMGGLRNTETSTQPWSGVSIEAQERQLFSALAEKASNAEQMELDIFRLYAKWEGEEFTGTVDYPRDFAIRDLTTALQNAISAGAAGVHSLIFEKERQKKIVDAVIPSMEEVQRILIFNEIEKLQELPVSSADPAPAVKNMGDGE